MRTRGVVVTVILFAGLAAVALVKLTADQRAGNARDTLERAASRLVECHESRRSYAGCTPGTSKVAVIAQTRRRFEIASTVEFGPTYSISRRRDGDLVRRCQPPGQQCPIGNWRSELASDERRGMLGRR